MRHHILLLCALVPNLVFAAGTLTVGLPAFPKGLLHYGAYEELAEAIDAYVFEPLVALSETDRKPYGVLAQSWRESPDHRRFTFTLRKGAHFADGKPVTAADVKFTWNAIQTPRHGFIPAREFFRSFESLIVENEQTVTFVAREPHYKNFEKLTELLILPHHGTADLALPFPKDLLGSGPYRISEVKLGDSVTLVRNDRYWGPRHVGFARLVFKAVPDPILQMEKLKNGELDIVYVLSAKLWATETESKLFQAGKLKTLVVKTARPFGMVGVAWNMRRPLFQDVKVRRALAMLLDRPAFLRDLYYGLYLPSTGIVKPDGPYRHPRNQPIAFDPKTARRLLREAGWRELGADGVLVKDGQRFSFEVLAKEAAAERFLTRYAETLKREGIELRIRIADWTTTLRRSDAREFDGVLISRLRDIEPGDFSLTWGSATAALSGSENVTGFSDPGVDRWAAELDRTFDDKKRRELVRNIDLAISQAAPVLFLWEPTALRFAYSARLVFDGAGYQPYTPWYLVFRDWREAPTGTR